MTRPTPLHHADAVHALHHGRALITVPMVRVHFRGEDVVPYLQTKLTADTRRWAETGGSRGVATDIKGRIVADASWHRTEDGAVALVPAHPEDPDPHPLVAHMERYVIMEDVEVTHAREDALLLVGGLDEGATTLPETWALTSFRDALLAAGTTLVGRPATVFLGPADHRQQLLRELAGPTGASRDNPTAPADSREASSPHTTASTSPGACIEVPTEALHTAEILSAVPRLHLDLLPGETIPLEAGLWEAVSFNKGCYLGQEVIERLYSRGRPNKRLCLLRWAGEPVPPRHALLTDERDAGFVTRSSAMSDGTTVALGYVRRRALDGDHALSLEGAQTPVERLATVGGETPTSGGELPW